MISAKSLLEAEVFEALEASVTGGQVFQDVPENQSYPIVVIGDMKAVAMGAKGDADRIITMTILSLASAEERAPVLALMAEVEAALDQVRFSPPGWTMVGRLIEDEAMIDDDGVTYVGSSLFEFLCLKT